MKCTENYVKLNFLSRSSNESSAKVAADFAAQLDPTLDELEDMKITVRKTFTNAIVHAYPDRLGKILLKLRIAEGGTLEITVRALGRGIEDVDRAT